MSNLDLIAEARQEASIHDKLGDGFSEGSEERAFYYGHRDRYKRLADALEAATERAREFFQHERDKELGRWRDTIESNALVYPRGSVLGARRVAVCNEANGAMEEVVEGGRDLSNGWAQSIANRYFAALDGVPEPEWKVQYGRRNRETGTLHWLTGDPRDDWWHENQDRYEHVKRYTSPPLPVEGEKP